MTTGPRIINLAGPSGSGKSALAQHLAVRLGAPSGAIVTMDSFYRDLSGLPPGERARTNFDHPDSIDWPLLTKVLAQLGQGKPGACPVYDYQSHTRRKTSRVIEPGGWLIVEGLFALFPQVGDLARVRVFVEAQQTLCLSRIMERDTRERAWSKREVDQRFQKQVWPMYLQHVLPTKQYAHLVVQGDAPLDDSAASVASLLEGGPA